MKNGPTCAVDLSITGLFQEDIRPIELHAKLFCKTSTNYGYDLYPGGIALGRKVVGRGPDSWWIILSMERKQAK